MLGTAGNLLMPMTQPRFDARLINSHHVGCERWLAPRGNAVRRGAGVVPPRVRARSPVGDAGGRGRGGRARHRGLIALPYLQGERTPVWDERARGAFVGLELAQGRGHLYRALLEGIALGFRHCMSVAEERGVTLRSRSSRRTAPVAAALLRQTLADALGVPLTWSSAGGGSTLAGAAILAGLGIGALASPRWRGGGPPTPGATESVRHEPDPRAHARLGDVFARRLALYAALRAADEG